MCVRHCEAANGQYPLPTRGSAGDAANGRPSPSLTHASAHIGHHGLPRIASSLAGGWGAGSAELQKWVCAGATPPPPVHEA